MVANPVPGLHVIRMSVLGKTGRLGLLRGEEALLLLSDFEQPSRRFSVRLGHNTILQDFRRFARCGKRRIRRRIAVRIFSGQIVESVTTLGQNWLGF